MSAAPSGAPSAQDVPTGNTFDKYGSSNPVVRRLMAGFEQRSRICSSAPIRRRCSTSVAARASSPTAGHGSCAIAASSG